MNFLEVLDNYDVLIIADPDLNYSSSEIVAIRNFVFNDGNSLLILAGGGLISEELNISKRTVYNYKYNKKNGRGTY